MLSHDEEQRLLEIERRLAAAEPDLARDLTTTKPRKARRALVVVPAVLIGVLLLVVLSL